MRALYIFPFICMIFLTWSGCSQKSSLPYDPPDADMLTPAPPARPRINGPQISGVRPGSPYLYRIPCTGERPIKFQSVNLPEGLLLDESTGIITGSLDKTGRYKVRLKATNQAGTDSREFTIVAGDTIALTPPMGWNSWYIHYDRVSDSLMRQAADQMIGSGMADFGYQYVNIDDCWMKKVDAGSVDMDNLRDTNGRLTGNEKFPDMKGLADYIHEKGLKAGLYISPGPTTCAGYAGSYGHEKEDARTFAEWGFDFLKYDWCSYGRVVNAVTKEDYMMPYRVMWNHLLDQDRDIVLNLCQYGMGDVWTWGGEVGNSWRTTGDLGLESDRELPGFYYIGMSNAGHWPYAHPGAWNDPDYILIGWVGDAHHMGEGTMTDLSPDEQYSYMSMWSLMTAPLIFSGDMGKLDAFTLNVLCNHEVIAVNQDPLGRQARVLKKSDKELMLVKNLSDGSKAFGLFNLTAEPLIMNISAADLGLEGSFSVRDLWRQKDTGNYSQKFSARVEPHGVMFARCHGK